MSPRSRGRRGDRRRPSDRRRSQHRATTRTRKDDRTASFVTDVLRASTELLTLDSPLDAEAFVSSVIGTWWQQPSESVAFGPALVAGAQRAESPEAVALLNGLAAIGDPVLAEQARAAFADLAARLELAPPQWAEVAGRVSVGDCFAVDEELGDATQVIMSFTYAAEPPHALVVLVDHNLGGLARDTWATGDAAELLAQVRETVAGDPTLSLSEASPAALKVALDDAFAATDQVVDPPVHDTFRHTRALALARVRGLPDGGVRAEAEPWTQDEQTELIEDFLASPEAAELPEDAARGVALELVSYGCEQDHGQPLRVSPAKLEILLLNWLPQTGLLDRAYVDQVPDVLPAWVRYVARRTQLSQASLDETLGAVDVLAPKFADAYDDTSLWGSARAAVESLLADLDPDEEDADEVFARRMFAVGQVPEPGFDADDEKSFAQLVEEEHPEYAGYLTNPNARPVVDGVDPRLHVAMHTAVARQLWFNDPPEVWTTAQRLLDAGYDRHNVLHALTFVLSQQVWGSLEDQEPHDPAAYRAALDALPGSWESTFAGDK
ncbi:DUF1841 family protein [Actinopolymorpha alba]|uniref:DUF1841 family protein n=1 Tax=Actinopolymorpha alba TaxID=533267 RepID=UPI00036DCF95|nr:DUF1841 family protein [Actinopolymorpha alba]